MSNAKLSESEKNAEYGRGHEDGQKGEFNHPKGDTLTDVVFAPLDAISGTPSTHEVAEAQSEPYREGHSSGSKNKKQDE